MSIQLPSGEILNKVILVDATGAAVAAAGGGGGPATIVDGGSVSLGAKADAAATDSVSAWSLISVGKGILAKLLASVAVTGTFWPPTQPVSGSVSVGNLPATQAISAAALPLPLGAASEGGNMATLVARTPAAGQATKAASSPVTLASDQGPLAVTPGGADGRAVNRRRPLPVAQAKPNILFRPFRDEDGVATLFGTVIAKVQAIEDGTSTTYDLTTGHRTCLFAKVYNWATYGAVYGSNGASYDFDFHGRVLAFRMIVPVNTPLVKFGIRIDGRAYRYDFTPHVNPQVLTADGQEFIRTFTVATDLPPGRHRCTFIFPCQQSTDNTWTITDLGVEDDGAVNKPFPATSQAPRIAPVQITQTAFPGLLVKPRSGSLGSQAFALRRLYFQNSNLFPCQAAWRPYFANGQQVTTPMSVAIPAATLSPATDSVTFAANPAAATTITLGGTSIMFVASGAVGNQVAIGANLAATLAALASFASASADANISLAYYSATATVFSITCKTGGAAGNTFTVSTTVAGATAATATLAGGGATTFSGTATIEAPAGTVWANSVECIANVPSGISIFYETAKG